MEEIPIPLFVNEFLPDFIEFKIRGNKIEIYVERVCFDEYKCNDSKEFIKSFLNTIGEHNKLDLVCFDEKFEELYTKKIISNSSIIAFYEYDLKDLYNKQ